MEGPFYRSKVRIFLENPGFLLINTRPNRGRIVGKNPAESGEGLEMEGKMGTLSILKKIL